MTGMAGHDPGISGHVRPESLVTLLRNTHDFIWTGGDCHIYANHHEQVELQLSRTPMAYPTLNIKRKPASIFDYEYEDFEVLGYEHHPAIKAPVAV
jgi:thymidylate synthase